MINATDINPMDWYGTRFLNYIPPHFTKFKFKHNRERLKVMEWLDAHTKGRCGIETVISPDAVQSWLINEELEIGFEDSSEATMFLMFFQ